MSVDLRLRGKLPDGDRNGLAFLGRELRDDPGTRVLIALVGPVALASNLETGDEVLSVGIEHVELTDTLQARELLRRLYQDRTGILELPLGVDPHTGEVANGPGVAELAELEKRYDVSIEVANGAGPLAEAVAAAASAAGVKVTRGKAKR